MICSYFSSKKTVQAITNEIMNILNMYEYAEFPFIVLGVHEDLISLCEILQDKIFFLQDSIELWYLDRKLESWNTESDDFYQKILLALKHTKLGKRLLFSLSDGSIAKEKYTLIETKKYLVDLEKIIINLKAWLSFLYSQEKSIYPYKEIHYSLIELFS